MKTLRLLTIIMLALAISPAVSARSPKKSTKGVTINVANQSGKAISVNLFKKIEDEIEILKPVWETGIVNLDHGAQGSLHKKIGAGTYELDVCNSSNEFSSCNRKKSLTIHDLNAIYNFTVTDEGIHETESLEGWKATK